LTTHNAKLEITMSAGTPDMDHPQKRFDSS